MTGAEFWGHSVCVCVCCTYYIKYAIVEQHLGQVSTHVELFLGLGTNALWSSMGVYIDPLTHLFSKKLNLPIGSQKLSTGLAYMKMKKSKNIGFLL
jgi:hypothetical protein